MKKTSKPKTESMPEYDFSRGIRGKYARRHAKGSNIVALDPDVARMFPDGQSVNQSLRNFAKARALLK
jgi:hypothetical protein